jgi:16S rRNA (guanine527-N7)-methyltransferase
VTGGEARRLADSGLGAPPPAAGAVFGDRLDLAQRYAARLAGDAVTRGLIGPREAGRLWERHLLNSAVLADFLPPGVRIVDVGSGAGLPGLVLAIRRPDLRVDLVEPMQRRIEFLDEVIGELGLSAAVRAIRGRADDAAVLSAVGDSDWVVARAVAPLDRLVRWCFPLLSSSGTLLALKGASAADELARHRSALLRLGARRLDVCPAGDGVLEARTWVVVVSRGDGSADGTARGGA